jgi:hypothetical protein
MSFIIEIVDTKKDLTVMKAIVGELTSELKGLEKKHIYKWSLLFKKGFEFVEQQARVQHPSVKCPIRVEICS